MNCSEYLLPTPSGRFGNLIDDSPSLFAENVEDDDDAMDGAKKSFTSGIT
jgi:hypothetical protein